MTITTKKTPTESFLEVISKKSTDKGFDFLKKKAIQYLQEKGLPHMKDEEYKYTSITKKIESSISNFEEADPFPLTAGQVTAELVPGLEADVLVFNNGRFDPKLSNWDEGDYSIQPLTDIVEEAKNKGFGSIAPVEKDPFTALNAASFQNGLAVAVPNGKIIKRPLLFLSFNQAYGGQTIFPRVFISVGKNAEVTFIEKIVSADEQVYFLNNVTELTVDENSHLHYYKLQKENREAIEVSNFETNIHRNGTFSSAVVTLQGDMIRNNLSLNLLDSGCEGNMYGLFLLNGKSHVDNHTNVDHIKPHSVSNELYKGILADKSRGVFNGKIFVRQDAQKTNAFQQNNNILLSEDAIINTKPQLEIWADDVKCSHGCTAGQLDEEALFYLQARGIGKEKAKGLLLYAFAGEVLDHIKDEVFRAYCSEQVQERLGSNF